MGLADCSSCGAAVPDLGPAGTCRRLDDDRIFLEAVHAAVAVG